MSFLSTVFGKNDPAPGASKKDDIKTKFLKNTTEAVVNKLPLAPILGVSAPIALAEGAVKTVAQTVTSKAFWNSNPLLKAAGSDLGIYKMPTFHTKTQITPGPGKMTDDQKQLQELIKLSSQQQTRINQMNTDLGNVIQDLYGNGPQDPDNNYGA